MRVVERRLATREGIGGSLDVSPTGTRMANDRATRHDRAALRESSVGPREQHGAGSQRCGVGRNEGEQALSGGNRLGRGCRSQQPGGGRIFTALSEQTNGGGR